MFKKIVYTKINLKTHNNKTFNETLLNYSLIFLIQATNSHYQTHE